MRAGMKPKSNHCMGTTTHFAVAPQKPNTRQSDEIDPTHTRGLTIPQRKPPATWGDSGFCVACGLMAQAMQERHPFAAHTPSCPYTPIRGRHQRSHITTAAQEPLTPTILHDGTTNRLRAPHSSLVVSREHATTSLRACATVAAQLHAPVWAEADAQGKRSQATWGNTDGWMGIQEQLSVLLQPHPAPPGAHGCNTCVLRLWRGIHPAGSKY